MNIPIKTLKLEICSLNDLKSPPKKTDCIIKKNKNLNNNEKSNTINKTSQKGAISFKETQKKIEKKNEEIENALKSLVTVKREALIQRHQIRQNFNKLDPKFSDQIKKTISIKKKIPELSHNFTKKILNFQETINFKDIFYLEPLTNKFSNKLFRKDYEFFEETIKADNNKKLDIVNRKFRKILAKIERKEFNNGFKQVLLTEENSCLQRECSSKSVEISAKVLEFFYKATKIQGFQFFF